jgi:hypothetical protein
MTVYCLEVPEGLSENSLAVHCWVSSAPSIQVPEGRLKLALRFYKIRSFQLIPTGLMWKTLPIPGTEVLGYCQPPLAGLETNY